jgi:hypothetical protein
MNLRTISNTIGLAALLWTSRAVAGDLAVVTPKGHVTFSVGDEWPAGTPTKFPAAVFAFQIPDPADEGTPHSTNVAVGIYDPKTVQGRDALKTFGKKYGTSDPKASRIGAWQVLEQSADQGGTRYVILDARRDVVDVTATVRLAWPQLAAHSKDYDRAMRETFRKLLDSVHGEVGQYQRKDGDVVSRPTP